MHLLAIMDVSQISYYFFTVLRQEVEISNIWHSENFWVNVRIGLIIQPWHSFYSVSVNRHVRKRRDSYWLVAFGSVFTLSLDLNNEKENNSDQHIIIRGTGWGKVVLAFHTFFLIWIICSLLFKRQHNICSLHTFRIMCIQRLNLKQILEKTVRFVEW